MKDEFTTILAIDSFLEANQKIINGQKCLKDTDAARMYGVGLKTIHRKVKQNPKRFPSDFIIKLPENQYAFTYPGLMMLGGMIKSRIAARASVQLIEFVAKNMEQATGKSVFDLLAEMQDK